jgi:urea ABC transporter urea binding protein
MTGTCPPDGELERLLARQMGDAEKQALEAHLAGCAACQGRLAQVDRGGLAGTPSSPDVATPIPERHDTAPPDAAGRPEEPATFSRQLTKLPSDPTSRPPAVPAPPGADPAPVFGRYQVRRALGSGGFAAVYLGHDTKLDRPVAIKVLRAATGLVQAEEERALQEARRLARLRHPGIVAVHDVGVHEGQVYIVSDYLDGPDLRRWLNDNRPAWPEAARIVAAVADALAHAHARLIVHRDVKPENILLTLKDEGGRMKDESRQRTPSDSSFILHPSSLLEPVLVDFGLALDETQAGGRSKGIVSGTPVYMSPEQAAGTAHRIDGRTDIYSLGVVLYELLTGRLPFQAEDTRELLRQVREDEPQPPRQLVRDLPPELERACLKALAKRQQDRYTTAADFADDLRRSLKDEGGRMKDEKEHQGRGRDSSFILHPSSFPAESRRRTGEAERRQVTVLVCGCDLFESEAYLDRLDAEEQAGVLRAFQQACADAVGRLDGTVVRCNEQGLLACFGYPVAYEDAAGRAARTGLALLEDLKALAERFPREPKLEMRPWVGLHTGPAVVEAGESTVSLVGEARSVAVRLEDVAAAGQVLCTEATHRLIGGQLHCRSLGRRKVKGVAQPVELFRVGGIGAARSPVEAAGPAGLTPLTGRDHEISLLKDRWEQTREGMGQVVLLTGEPGLGKSRLVYTLKEHVRGQAVEGEVDAPVIEWRCAPHFQNTGLYPAIDFYERALGFGREEPPPARFDRLLHRLEQYELARPEAVPLWAALLSLPVPDRYPALALSPARQREETFRAMLEWLQVRAARKPVVFVVEDLHWADASTLEFLGLFLAEGLHDRILAVLTFRPEFRPPWPAAARQTSLALNPLTRRQVGDLMRHRAGGAVPEALVEQIFDRSGGVPLFVEEFTQMVQESGAPTGALPPHEIPATLQDLVMARLEHLGGGRELAQLAATLGREFSHELLAAVATLEEPALQAELARLVQAEILYPKGRPPRCTYVFKHALLEDALYNSLVKGKRQQFHHRIAEVLEAQFPQTARTQPELLAHHFSEAGRAAKGVDYWLKAGLRSRERSAEVEAIGHLTRGLALLETLDESAERDLRELDLLIPLGTAYIAARGYAAPEVGPVFRRARERCERVGQPPQRFALLLGIWEWHTVRADLRLCTDLAAEGMEFARRHDDPGMVMEALFTEAETLLYRAKFAGARDRFATAVAEYDDRERTRFWAGHTSHNAGVTCRSNLAVSLWHLGYPDQALRVNREMCQLAREIGHPFSLAYALHHTAWLYQLCRLGAEVRAAAEEELAIAAEQGFALWHATGTCFRGAGMLLQGETEEALPLLLKGLQAFRAGGAELTLPSQLGALGDAHTRAGRFDEARRALDEGLALAEKHDERFQEAELHRLKGELLLAESPDQADAAEDCFRQAIETARRQQSRAWELRATMSLARLWDRQGRLDEARDALAAVYGTYTEGFTTPDLVDAAALLETLTHVQPSALTSESKQADPTPVIWGDSSLEVSPVVLPESLVGAPQPAADDRTTEAWAGKSLGKYQITGVLGRGGMGVVLKARDLMIERDVAIKVLAGHLTTDVAALGRFLAEARAAGRLNHPNVTAIYEIGQERQTHYLVLEYVAGGSLQDRLAGEKPLPVPEATQALIDACKGVGAAHAAGLIHRDIKPANFMRAADGSIKVTDFGLAKGATDSGMHFTRTGMVVGTPFYMSPEQCEAKPLDHRSDLYALGATYYTLLTGKHPYHETESAVQLMYLHCHGPVLDPRSENSAVPEACSRIVGRAMAKAPAERYQSAAEMLADLQAVAAALSGQAPVAPPGERSIPPSAPGGGEGSGLRRRRIRRAVAGLCLLALLGVAVLSWQPWRKSPTGPPGAGTVPPAGEPVKVGVLHSLSGTMAQSETVVADATLFALDEVNQAGGVLGRPVTPVVADGRSDWPTFKREAERLLTEEQVCTVFGCWTSASRKTVKPVFEGHDHLLIYPVQYEGLETSPCIVYMGAAPNQQILPAVQWALTKLHKQRFFLVGSDYVFPRAAHAIIKDQLRRAGAQVVGEEYVPLGGQRVGPVVAAVARAKPDMILNTINGDSNTAFFRALRAAGIKPADTPTLSFSVGEQEVRSLNLADAAGDYAAWTYFQSVATPENEAFVRRFHDKYPRQSITDPMETAYVGVKLWALAVNEAQSLDPKKIRRALLNQRLKGPDGEVRIDPDSQHCFRTPRIGRIQADGQFQVVWTAPAPVRPEPYPGSRTAEAWRGLLHDLYTGWGNRWAAPESEAAPATGEGLPVLAVLPFVNTAADPETEYLRDGIPGALLKKLSEVAQLAVRPYGGAPKKSDEELDLRAIGRKLEAQAVLTGRVRQTRDRLSIHVQLVNVRDNRVIWVEQYERRPADLQDVETDIAQRVCARLGLALSRDEDRRLSRRDTADPEAHQLYLQGRYHMLQSTLEGMNQSLACFKQAIARDPKYALAHAGLADTYGYYAGDWLPYADALPLQKAAARKALELDDDLAEAHLAMGNVFMGQDYDWPAADKEFQRAIALKPRLDLAHDAYAQFLAFQGRFDESLAEQKAALEIDPHSPYLIANLSYLYYLQRRYDRALEQARKALEIDPNYVAAHDYLGAAYLRQGQVAEALGEIRKSRQLDDVPWYLARLAAAQAVAGNQGEARTLLKELQELSKRRQVTPECYFLVYAGLGDKDRAFEWLQRMVDVRSQYPLRLKVDPTFDSLRADPRFADWLRRLKLAP